MKKKIFGVIAIVVFLIILLVIPSIKEKKEKKAMIYAMQQWAGGESYESDLELEWETEDSSEVKEEAIKIINDLKNDSQKLVHFLGELEDADYENKDVKQAFKSIDISSKERVFLSLLCIESEIDYYIPVESTIDLVREYIDLNGNKPVYINAGEGGFYDGEKDSYNKVTHGIEGSPLYTANGTHYCGDFKIEEESGVKLNSFYQEVSYSEETVYFKENYLGSFDYTEYEWYSSGKYLFGIGVESIRVENLETGSSSWIEKY